MTFRLLASPIGAISSLFREGWGRGERKERASRRKNDERLMRSPILFFARPQLSRAWNRLRYYQSEIIF